MKRLGRSGKYSPEEIIDALLQRRKTPAPQVGRRWGYLTFTGRFGFVRAEASYSGIYRLTCECVCKCESIRFYELRSLTRGRGPVRACGCTRKQKLASRNGARGRADRQERQRLYWVWRNMLARCEDATMDGFARYGGRGIRVWAEWHDFETFYGWAVSTGARKGLELERIDNDGHYAPANCRWATEKEQGRNKRNNVLITAWGETKPLSAWLDDERCSVRRYTLQKRLDRGMSPESALATPPRSWRRQPQTPRR